MWETFKTENNSFFHGMFFVEIEQPLIMIILALELFFFPKTLSNWSNISFSFIFLNIPFPSRWRGMFCFSSQGLTVTVHTTLIYLKSKIHRVLDPL